MVLKIHFREQWKFFYYIIKIYLLSPRQIEYDTLYELQC